MLAQGPKAVLPSTQPLAKLRLHRSHVSGLGPAQRICSGIDGKDRGKGAGIGRAAFADGLGEEMSQLGSLWRRDAKVNAQRAILLRKGIGSGSAQVRCPNLA
jgi:hypothetical protein